MEPSIATEHFANMTLLDRFHAGGIFMYPILFIGIICLAIIFERINALFFKASFNKSSVLTEVRNAIYAGNLSVMGGTIVHQIIQSGFRAFEKSQKDSEVQLAIDGAASKHFPSLEKRTSYLSMLANIATLLGLLGTISGLIISFGGAAKADPNEKATLLAAGISEAMNCTAFGLCVAIPALLAYAFLQGRTQKVIDDINEVVLESMNFVISHREKFKTKA